MTFRARAVQLLVGVGLAAFLATGCAVARPLALKGIAGALSGSGGTIMSHDDPETVRGALDFALITNESLLASIPNHEPLLVTTCSQYTQYAFGFVYPEAERIQFDDYEKAAPVMQRAFRLAERGRTFCWRALEVKFRGITDALRYDPSVPLRKARREHVPLLYWSAASLGASISLGGLDHPELVIQWPTVRALAKRALELDETWNHGALHELMITIESQGEEMGGSEARARQHFQRAVDIQHTLSPGPYVSLATGVAKAKRDREEFEQLLNKAIAIDPEQDPANRLVIILTRQRAKALLDHIDDIIPK